MRFNLSVSLVLLSFLLCLPKAYSANPEDSYLTDHDPVHTMFGFSLDIIESPSGNIYYPGSSLLFEKDLRAPINESIFIQNGQSTALEKLEKTESYCELKNYIPWADVDSATAGDFALLKQGLEIQLQGPVQSKYLDYHYRLPHNLKEVVTEKYYDLNAKVDFWFSASNSMILTFKKLSLEDEEKEARYFDMDCWIAKRDPSMADLRKIFKGLARILPDAESPAPYIYSKRAYEEKPKLQTARELEKEDRRAKREFIDSMKNMLKQKSTRDELAAQARAIWEKFTHAREPVEADDSNKEN